MKRARLLAVVACVVASVAAAAPASAFTAPELFVRMQRWDTHEAASDWIPLASAPALNYLGGYEIGYRLEASGEPNEFQRVALTVAAVLDGRPTQPLASPPYCVGRAGAVGTIVAAGPELQFEGNGTYTVTVSVGPGSGGASDCLSGPSTTGSFGVDVHVAPTLAGEPLSFRAVALPGDPFVGVQAPAPPGGEADIRCALNGTVGPDGSVTGSAVVPESDFSHPTVPEFVFPRPGAWTCVARGTAAGMDENLDTADFGTPWSGPLPIEVRSDFRYLVGAIARPRSKRPRLTFTAEWPDVALGGRGRVTLRRVTGCKGRNFRLRKLATYRGRFGAERLRITMRRPRAGFYIGSFSFSGTHLLARRRQARPDAAGGAARSRPARDGARVRRLPGLPALTGGPLVLGARELGDPCRAQRSVQVEALAEAA